MPWDLYIIRTRSGKLYTGITTDLDRRLAEHTSGRGAKFFRTSAPECVVYRERLATRSEASRRERQVKRMTRAQKLALIAEQSNGFDS